MADIPGNSSTTAVVTVGSTTTDSLETIGDRDWFRITLTAGQAITITVNGITLEDSYLRIRNSSGTLLAENDDISSGVIRDSKLSFTASSSGTYFIDVGSFDDNYAGTYQLGVANYTPPPIATMDQFADQLVRGYWGGDSHHFNVTQGGSVSVNITGLTAAGQNLAREALGLWSDIIGVNFTEVATGGKIMFDDNEEGAHSDGIWSRGITSSANVNVSTKWLTDYGTNLNSYSFQSYVHEIGHALGLGHAGNYNMEASYPNDALFVNDSWAASIMSYFDQQENSYFAGLGFTETFVLTPMMADIVAMATMYGLSTTTRTGNTTYGFNSNAGRAVFNASLNADVAYTIFDSGGVDTLDYSGFSQNQKVNLTAETYSDVGVNVGNVAIARGVVIENAIGGSGNDEINGNAANNVLSGGAGADILRGLAGNDTLVGGGNGDTLTGGDGADTFRDTIANLNFDSITDFTAQDRIVFADANSAAFNFSLSSSTLSFTGGQLTLANFSGGALFASAAVEGGVQLRLLASPANDDFNGDGRSDILWRNDNGSFGDWLANGNGGFGFNAAAGVVPISNNWKIAGTGDFNGDGRSDMLWREDGGGLGNWLANASGGFAYNSTAGVVQVSASWHVAGTGDFNGDGRDDILWRNDSGELAEWLANANGSFASNAVAGRSVSTDWHVVATGDFNGDGRDDILWRSDGGMLGDWMGSANGDFIVNSASLIPVATNWHVAGTGDFNGDSRDDILWRNDAGAFGDWLGTATGGFTYNDAAGVTAVTNDWHVANTGDYNGDGRDDILWRNDHGVIGDWLANSSGGFAYNVAGGTVAATTDWHIPSPDILFV